MCCVVTMRKSCSWRLHTCRSRVSVHAGRGGDGQSTGEVHLHGRSVSDGRIETVSSASSTTVNTGDFHPTHPRGVDCGAGTTLTEILQHGWGRGLHVVSGLV